MITEDYVSFETAKLLKEKGFDWNTDKQFNLDKIIGDYNITDRSRYPERYLDAPTLQMAMKWLREIHEIFIAINIIPNTTVTMEQRYYFFKPYKNRRIHNFPLDYSIQCYETYEEACEAGIKYCLENLI